MRIGNLKKIGRWQFVFHWGKDYAYSYGEGWRELQFGIVRTHTLPPDGACFQHGKHYSGFWCRLSVWVPIVIRDIR